MIVVIDRHDVLTICKFSLWSIFIPKKYVFFVWLTMLHIKKLVGMYNKETYTRVYTRICVRIYSYMCTYWHTRICKIRSYNTRMHSSLISELHCSYSKTVLFFCHDYLFYLILKSLSGLKSHTGKSYLSSYTCMCIPFGGC